MLRVREEMSKGTVPTTSVVEGVLIFVAGVVLVTPGALTDLCGILLLIRPIRAYASRRLIEFFSSRIVIVGGPADPNDDFIDVEATPTHRPSSADHEARRSDALPPGSP